VRLRDGVEHQRLQFRLLLPRQRSLFQAAQDDLFQIARAKKIRVSLEEDDGGFDRFSIALPDLLRETVVLVVGTRPGLPDGDMESVEHLLVGGRVSRPEPRLEGFIDSQARIMRVFCCSYERGNARKAALLSVGQARVTRRIVKLIHTLFFNSAAAQAETRSIRSKTVCATFSIGTSFTRSVLHAMIWLRGLNHLGGSVP
jgi:hypothetical protein